MTGQEIQTQAFEDFDMWLAWKYPNGSFEDICEMASEYCEDCFNNVWPAS